MCANHSKILGGKTETYREKEWKDKAVVTIGDVFQLKKLIVINWKYKLNNYPPGLHISHILSWIGFLIDEFLDMINKKTKNINVGNDNLDNV